MKLALKHSAPEVLGTKIQNSALEMQFRLISHSGIEVLKRRLRHTSN
jgi:hypothetical protein